MLAALVLAELGAIAAYSSVGGAQPVVQATPQTAATTAAAAMRAIGNTEEVGWLLYSNYLIPFEVASMLLLVAMIGAIVLAKRDL